MRAEGKEKESKKSALESGNNNCENSKSALESEEKKGVEKRREKKKSKIGLKSRVKRT